MTCDTSAIVLREGGREGGRERESVWRDVAGRYGHRYLCVRACRYIHTNTHTQTHTHTHTLIHTRTHSDTSHTYAYIRACSFTTESLARVYHARACTQAWHAYYICTDTTHTRTFWRQSLRERAIRRAPSARACASRRLTNGLARPLFEEFKNVLIALRVLDLSGSGKFSDPARGVVPIVRAAEPASNPKHLSAQRGDAHAFRVRACLHRALAAGDAGADAHTQNSARSSDLGWRRAWQPGAARGKRWWAADGGRQRLAVCARRHTRFRGGAADPGQAVPAWQQGPPHIF